MLYTEEKGDHGTIRAKIEIRSKDLKDVDLSTHDRNVIESYMNSHYPSDHIFGLAYFGRRLEEKTGNRVRIEIPILLSR